MNRYTSARVRRAARQVDREANASHHRDSALPVKLRVAIAYSDRAAGRRAMNLLTRIRQHEPNGVHFRPTLWRVDLLEDPDWREKALADAVAADLLILATSASHSLPACVDRWMSEVLSQRRGSSTAILVTFGADDEWSILVQEDADAPENAALPPRRPRAFDAVANRDR